MCNVYGMLADRVNRTQACSFRSGVCLIQRTERRTGGNECESKYLHIIPKELSRKNEERISLFLFRSQISQVSNVKSTRSPITVRSYENWKRDAIIERASSTPSCHAKQQVTFRVIKLEYLI